MATNQERLQSIVLRHATGQPFLDEFCHIHLSVRQKLWSVDYFHNQIIELKPEILYEQRTKGYTLVLDQYTDKEGFGFYANLLLDGFLMNAMSAFDTLAHEIKVLYRFRRVPPKLYIHTIKDCLVRDHSHCALTMYLSREMVKPWFDTFATYRHCTTHESLVGSNVRFDVSLITGDLQQVYVPLPDDARSKPFTYRHDRELKSFCGKVNKRVITMVRHSYYCIIQDIKAANNVLPIT